MKGWIPNSWMVFVREHPIKMSELGVPLFQETPHIPNDLQFMNVNNHSHSIHVWNIHLHLPQKSPKCR